MKLDEYKEVSASLRQYGTMRFSQLTLISAITGAAVVGGQQITLGLLSSLFIPLAALALTIALWIMEESSTRYWILYRERAIELENELNFKHYSLRPKKRKLSATNAVRFIYSLLAIFWLLNSIKEIIEIFSSKII